MKQQSNVMTTAEADEKWCPMTFNGEVENCVSDKCMLWMWHSNDNGYCGYANLRQ